MATVVRTEDIQIGELARQSGSNIETIRYYERAGLLAAPQRSAGGYRLYEAADVRRLAFVRRARELGFTLDQVRALLALSEKDGRDACTEVHDLAAGHLFEVRAKIADLRAMERVLADAVRRCAAGELPGCPIIDALSVDAVSRKNSPRQSARLMGSRAGSGGSPASASHGGIGEEPRP